MRQGWRVGAGRISLKKNVGSPSNAMFSWSLSSSYKGKLLSYTVFELGSR